MAQAKRKIPDGQAGSSKNGSKGTKMMNKRKGGQEVIQEDQAEHQDEVSDQD